MVKEFISDDATVVVGTVIDSDMTDEMRVTVIVTGLGEEEKARPQKSAAVNQAQTPLFETQQREGRFDYKTLDKPAVARKKIAQSSASAPSAPSAGVKNETVPDVDYLDIPAFLRRHEHEEV